MLLSLQVMKKPPPPLTYITAYISINSLIGTHAVYISLYPPTVMVYISLTFPSTAVVYISLSTHPL